MRTWLQILASIVAIAAGFPACDCLAGPNADVKILIHLVPDTSVPGCSQPHSKPTCNNVVTSGDLYPYAYYAYLLVTDADQESGIGGFTCGIEYGTGSLDETGIDIWSWTLCASGEASSVVTNWPESGSWNSLSWDSNTQCQNHEPGGIGTGVTTAGGYFHLTAYSAPVSNDVSYLFVVPRSIDGIATVSSCFAVVDTVQGGGHQPSPNHLGHIALSPGSVVAGFSPCGLATSVFRSTWGGIKALLE
jgi:hypothetical protein